MEHPPSHVTLEHMLENITSDHLALLKKIFLICI